MFGNTTGAAGSTSGGIFGNSQNNNTNSSTPFGGGLFGANPAGNTGTTSGGSAFGTSPFTAKPAGTSAFGSAPTTTPATGTSAFGSTQTGSSTGLFGSTPAATGTTPAPSTGLFGGAPKTSAFGLGSGTAPASGSLFGQGPAAPSSTPAATTGNTSTPSSGLFSGFGAKPAGQTPTPSATPTTGPANSFFGGSAAPSGGGLFGGQTTNADNSNKPPTSGLFGGGSGTAAPASGSTPTPNLFNTAPKPAEASSTSTAGSAFGGGLFGKKPDAPAGSTAPAPPTLPAFNLGGNKDAGASGGTSATPAASTAPSNFFGQPPSTSKPEEKKDSSTANPAPSPFGLFGTKPAAAATPTPATSTTTSTEKKDTPATSTSTGATSAFGSKPATTPAANAPGAPTATTSSNANAAPTTTSSAISVPPPSMLRGKTIEEIVNRWSTDLEVQVREFNKFASEVSAWDRSLVENGNNLAALYNAVLAAEREQNDIDQSIDLIEQQQKDLSSTLEAYEKTTQELLGGQGGNLRALDTGPADTERDKNYMLATDLHGQLDDLSQSLVQMIESVNTLSEDENAKTNPSEDPMTQIAQILSSHLESLQWIDGAVKEVESKVTDVERRVRGVSDGLGSSSGKSRGYGLGR
ncbi:nucleoporin NSP1/NUP62 family protein [Abortiporus biennis]